MKFTGFEQADFEVFEIEGLEGRMNALIQQLRPKFYELAEDLTDPLRDLTGVEMFAHVAKHARRTTNPPRDSWVAFASNKRGYKMMPHFQIAVWPTHVLIQWGIIYEAPDKVTFANQLLDNIDTIRATVPAHYQWSKDHMKPEGQQQSEMRDEDFEDFANRLKHNKNGEIMVGLRIAKEEAISMTPEEFLRTVQQVYENLLYLHRLAHKAS